MLDKYLLNLIRKTPVLLLYSHTSYTRPKTFLPVTETISISYFFQKQRLKSIFSPKAGNPKEKKCYSNVLSLHTVLCLSQYKEVKYSEFFQ